mmetsp:Transcript_19277/g.43694  ORF Transcript_19277/g.43694 Transcript_19277/m.43694 type:complete len:522 (+) Transcript_19277:247-1812(+)|eukprot:CAMPEP_0172615126 /NCGR_PEP_ID=MMETSP1068-20121228/55852_1 /TAXON_ID=35684 /ORGANISM="Pseudopedinella elastica, Strain CCMP716" /LENGTH=521 /DNA_ID=CAMNT_0013420157 /DNA_START=245 /DNA_END=1810 /DNA_ORIENTATION=-
MMLTGILFNQDQYGQERGQRFSGGYEGYGAPVAVPPDPSFPIGGGRSPPLGTTMSGGGGGMPVGAPCHYDPRHPSQAPPQSAYNRTSPGMSDRMQGGAGGTQGMVYGPGVAAPVMPPSSSAGSSSDYLRDPVVGAPGSGLYASGAHLGEKGVFPPRQIGSGAHSAYGHPLDATHSGGGGGGYPGGQMKHGAAVGESGGPAVGRPKRGRPPAADRAESGGGLQAGGLPAGFKAPKAEAKAKRAPRVKKTPEQQKADRRERNRRHARCSRARKKLLIDALQKCIESLQEENRTMHSCISERFGEEETTSLIEEHSARLGPTLPGLVFASPDAAGKSEDLVASSSSPQAVTVLEDPDFLFIKALKQGKQNFVITDPHLPDNPIIYASQGFLDITGYSLDQVLGRNCRFIQGPLTDLDEVAKMRKAISEGADTSVCLLNYRMDGSTFWNQVHCAPLRNQYGEIVNFVGVQCEVTHKFAAQSENASNLAASAASNSAAAAGAGGGARNSRGDEDDYDDDDYEDDEE